MSITVSVTCPNCGNPVVLSLNTSMVGGFVQCCYNCSANVVGSYSWGVNDTPIIRYVRAMGGAKRR